MMMMKEIEEMKIRRWKTMQKWEITNKLREEIDRRRETSAMQREENQQKIKQELTKRMKEKMMEKKSERMRKS